MDEFSQNKYTTEEVTRIIKRALELKREGNVNHEDLLHTAEELGLDRETLEEAIKKEKAEFENTKALEDKKRQKMIGFRRHLWGFVIVNTGLFLINAFTPGVWWFQWPLLGWGMGLALKYRDAYYPATTRNEEMS